MIAELPFQLVPDAIHRRRDILCLGVGPEGLPGDPEGRLDPLEAVDPGVVLVDHLEVQRGRTRLDAPERGELLLCEPPDRVGHLQAPPRERHVHPWRSSCRETGSRPADLVFCPTPACWSARPAAWTSTAPGLPPSPGRPLDRIRLRLLLPRGEPGQD